MESPLPSSPSPSIGRRRRSSSFAEFRASDSSLPLNIEMTIPRFASSPHLTFARRVSWCLSDMDDESNELLSDAENMEVSKFRKALKTHRHRIFREVDQSTELYVIEVHPNGSYKYRDMKRSDILKMSREIVPETANNEKGSPPLALRDLRHLESTEHVSEPSIRFRHGCILFFTGPVNAVVFETCCLLILPPGADSMLTIFLQRMCHPASEDESILSFRLRSLEAVLLMIINLYSADFSATQERGKTALNILRRVPDVEALDSIRRCRIDLDRQEQDAWSIRCVLDDLIDSDTSFSSAATNTKTVRTERLEGPERYAFELLAEVQISRLDSIAGHIREFRQQIDENERSLSLLLASSGNKLMRFEIAVKALSAVLTVGAVVTGMFGMNLKSGVSTDPYWFMAVCLSILFISLLAPAAMMVYIRKSII
eukprot:GILK01008657.1.p1 GENE.GILK01008657.1~~GILK01008657.1.p1  ORF type:complete len:428 (+),score=79.75 GILK01008657.1:50-1333(+)